MGNNKRMQREQRMDKALRSMIQGFERVLNVYNVLDKKGEEKFKIDGREYLSMPEYIIKNSAGIDNDSRCAGAKRLHLKMVDDIPPGCFVFRPDKNSVAYRIGDEAERELTGHDKAVMREVFGYLARKQNKEITVAQDRGQFGTVREQDRSQSGASMFGTTVVRMKTPEDVEKLCQHGLYPQLVAAANDKNDDHNLMVVFQHRSATQAEREQFIGQLKKICPEVMTTTPSDVVPVAGTVKAIGKLPGKFSVVLMTNSEINLDKVIGHGRAYQASDLER